MFMQQVVGVINLSLPIIFLAQIFPTFVFSIYGMLTCSLLIGAYAYWLNRSNAKKMVAALKYVPGGTCLSEFEALIAECGVDPKRVVLHYAYTYESVAMAVLNTIIIDPIVWQDVAHDEGAQKVRLIFETSIEPSLTEQQKTRLREITLALTPGAQRFIFKHELGHVVRGFSGKKLVVIFVDATLAALSGLFAARLLMSVSGLVALAVGMMIGGVSDLLLTLVFNAVFKVREEKLADEFAVCCSSEQDIQAAADFFEKHQRIMDAGKNHESFWARMPSEFATGHPHGVTRATFLRARVAQKVK